MRSTDREGHDASAPSTGGGSERPNDVLAQARLVTALCAAVHSRVGVAPDLIETHISYVLLTAGFAYKIKKAVSLGFLDFRTLEARRFYCDEELRLNRRLAPEIYLDVVPITGSTDAPTLGGNGATLDYAVRMREFPQAALAVHVLERGELSAAHVSALARKVAAFHRIADRAPPRGPFGAPDVILRVALQNFAHLRPPMGVDKELEDLDALEAWTRKQHADVAYAMAQRRDDGFVRECHGDLHLGNIAVLEDRPLIFDCIEFNEEMRWIDVMSEVAFTTMDLCDRGRADLAYGFLDTYLEITGDYAGLTVLRFYLVYRALVRAKIARLRAHQCAPGDAADALRVESVGYVRLARGFARPGVAAIAITHGLSGSGKTTVARALVEAGGAIRIRTDVERKRLHGIDPAARAGFDEIDADLYTPASTHATYRRALALAQYATAAGYVAIVDGAFLRRWQRRLFKDLAAKSAIPLVILACGASNDVLRERIARRNASGNDASDADLAELDRQLKAKEPLAPDERPDAIVVDTAAFVKTVHAAALWQTVGDRIDAAAGASCRSPASSPVAP